jgi:hypothetical protein
MQTKFIEATNGPRNWGKFMLARFTDKEWMRRSKIVPGSLVASTGWSAYHVMVFDLQTGEGAIFRQGGNAKADLDKHQIWVCPMFEPFLTWLYQQDISNFDTLPAHIDLPDAEFSLHGYRRGGANAKG